MAANNFISGGVDNNWGTAGNWSLGSVPTSGDGNVATFTAASPKCTVNASNRVCNAITFAAYANTITMTYDITVSGAITLGAGMFVSGSGALVCNTTCNLTSNGFFWPSTFILSGTSQSYTLVDNWNVSTLTLAGATAGALIGNIMYCVSLSQTTTAIWSNTTTITMNGAGIGTTGTWSNSSTGALRNYLTFNSAGTINITGNVYYNIGTMTYTAGTMSVAGSTLNCAGSTTLNTSGITWNNITITGSTTIILTSDLNVVGTLQLGATASVTTINGAFNVNVSGKLKINTTSGYTTGTATVVLTGIWQTTAGGNIRNNITINTGATISGDVYYYIGTLTINAGAIITVIGSTLNAGLCTINANNVPLNNYKIIGNTVVSSDVTINGLFSSIDSASHISFVSSVGGTQRTITMGVGTTQDLGLVDFTDIISTPLTLWTFRGVITNCFNIKTLTVPPTVAYSF